MATRLEAAHLSTQQRLRALVVAAITGAWRELPSYDDTDVAAYIAAALNRAPLGIDPAGLTGSVLRAGVPLEQVYRRPFVTAWTALSNGTAYEDAVNAGRARAASSAAMDIQLAHRAAYAGIQAADPAIRGYQRVADASACQFCRIVNGAFVKSATAMPLHNGCGCGLRPVTRPVADTPPAEGVAVHEHGELGPVLTDPAHHFTSLADFG
jgi:hypothetical protein